ncbi:MAG: hypothetical protein AB8G11_02460 [Saprospiraceae bacterium]
MNIKKIAYSLVIALFAVTFTAFGQDDPNKAFKNANSAFARYSQSNNSDVEKLEEAKKNIDIAISNKDGIIAKKLVGALMAQGKIYTALSTNATTKVKYEDALDVAYDAYKAAMNNDLAKKFQKVSSAQGLATVANGYLVRGYKYYDMKNLKGAYQDFNKILEIHELVVPVDSKIAPLTGNTTDANGLPMLDDKGEVIPKYPEHLRNTAMLAAAAGETKAAIKLYEKILAKGDKSANVYNGLYTAYIDADEAKAFEYLEEGRKAFPENTELLYSEINYFLKKGDTEKLQANLAKAIAADPENKTLYSVFGNTYDNLMKDAKDDETREKMKAEAIKYYEIALEKDSEYADVVYSLGAIYYNEAVRYAKTRSELPYSAKEEYEAATKDFQKYVVLAHPYFVKSEKINPSDRSTIIALKELYAQANRIEISSEFKKRLATVEEGGKVDAAYGEHPTTEELFKK